MKHNISKVLAIVLLLSFIISYPITSYATVRTSGDTEYKVLFAVPNGGYSVAVVRMNLSETFSQNSSKHQNYFIRHQKSVLAQLTGATEIPSIKVSNISHHKKDGSTITAFKSYNKQDAIYGQEWNWSQFMYNTERKIYSMDTTNYSTFSVVTSCTGGIAMGSSSFNVKVNLR